MSQTALGGIELRDESARTALLAPIVDLRTTPYSR